MKKMLFATTVAGTLRHFLVPFAQHFRRQGWQVDAAASEARSCPICTAAFDQVWDVSWSRSPADLSNLRRATREIRTLVAREDYDLVHVHTPVAAFITRFAMRWGRRRSRPAIIYTAHGFHFHRGGKAMTNWAFLQLEKAAGRWTDYLVTINQEDYAAAVENRLVERERVAYMPGIGVDLEIYARDKADARAVVQLRKSLDLDVTQRLFLVVGELNHNKRPDLILAAFASLPQKHTCLAYVGPGYLEARLRAQAARLGVLERTHFLGPRSDVPLLLAAADVFILASKREGLPRSIMEALCMECPCIGSDARGTRDLLANGCGVIVKGDDPASLAQAMSWVLEHPDAARGMARQGRQKMVDYDIRHILKLHEDLYAKALAPVCP